VKVGVSIIFADFRTNLMFIFTWSQ